MREQGRTIACTCIIHQSTGFCQYSARKDNMENTTLELHFSPEEAEKAQQAFTAKYGAPMFAPMGGICYGCGSNIYLPHTYSNGHVRGYAVDWAAKHLITRCPFCSKSFTD